MYKNRLDELKNRIEKDQSVSTTEDSSERAIERLQTQVAFLEAEKVPQDSHKKLKKLEK